MSTHRMKLAYDLLLKWMLSCSCGKKWPMGWASQKQARAEWIRHVG
jgi:hypothetical protein